MSNNSDIARIPSILENNLNTTNSGRTQAYVSNVNGRNKPADTVIYEKALGEKSYYVVEAIPDTKNKAVYIVSAFIGKSGYKKEILQSTNAKSPGATPKSEAANISTDSIHPDGETVNNNLSGEAGDYSMNLRDNALDLLEGKISLDEYVEK